LYYIENILDKLNDILDSATSILGPNFGYPSKVMGEDPYAALYSDSDSDSYTPATHVEDLFQEIYGHENIKALMNMALRSEKSVHVLLTSPPGMAKTQFLLAIRNTFENESCFVVGSNSTKKGIIDLLFENRPHTLLIDELETMSYDTQESLLNLMETGIISETKKTYNREMQLDNIKVFATSNDTKNLLSPLLSRFIVLIIPPYTDEEFIEIAVQRLTNEEGISEELAIEIAKQVIQKMDRKDLRDCIKVARIARTLEEVASIISIMK
jgi:holliday junction DNA helicase RuvB